MKLMTRASLVVACVFSVSTLAIAEKKKDITTDASKAASAKPAAKATDKKAPVAQDKGKKSMVHVTLDTSMGKIKLELDKEKAPISVENFLGYVNSGHYSKTIFHRVIKGFMIQGGGMDEKMTEKTTRKPIENEAKNGLKNDRGAIAMARTNDPNSATAQFFINTVNNDFLNPNSSNPAGYAVFGKVIEGMDVVDKIAAVKTTTKANMSDVPASPITIESATIEK